MAVLPIIKFPHPVLKTRVKPVEGINQAVEKLIQDMTDTMYDAPGVGLAANQVGAPLSILVADPENTGSEEEEDREKDSGKRRALVIINPRIVRLSEETEAMEEGCLSVPDFRSEVERAVRITLLGKNMKGEDIQINAEGFIARVLQHEIDHLQGVLFIDRIGRLKRQRYIRELKKKSKTKKNAPRP